MPDRRRKRVLRWSALALALVVAGSVALLLLPLPAPALARLANASSAWILTDYDSPGPLPSRAARKAVGLAVQQGLAAEFLASRPLPEGLPDAERIGRRLSALKRMTISQMELLHAPVNAPVALAGVGWCDGINAFAGIVLSHEFAQPELIGIPYQKLPAGHSVGRLWSRQHSDWLYFDAWPDTVAVFRSRGGRPVEYLFRQRPLGPRPPLAGEDRALIERLYARASSGFVHNRLQPTLGGYVGARLWNLVRHGNRAPPGAAEAVAQAGVSPVPADLRGASSNATPAPAPYVRARLAHFRGDKAAARAAYAEVVAAEGGARSTYGRAAQIFIERIEHGLF